MSRPTRMSSPSRKTISIRVTPAEHELLSKAAHPMYLSDWLRQIAFESYDVKQHMPPSENEAPEVTDLRAMMAMFDLKLRTLRDVMRGDTDKLALVDAIEPVVRKMFGLTVALLRRD
jgi:hypothetical protein